MCGICGIYSFEGLLDRDRDIVKAMGSSLLHRGPDDSGEYHEAQIAMGMRRLSIIDLKGGRQPMANEDQTIWIVFNGEIYNYRELREDLEKSGHRFRTGSDTETIIHSYEEYGEECVSYLNGMFAFAIWDSPKRRLFAARDRLGQKPLYYTMSNNRFYFGSELKSLLKDPTIERRLDPIALHYYMTLQYVPDPWTIYEGIKKLPPAHRLICDKDGLKISRYWDLSFLPKLHISKEEAMEELNHLLSLAVKRRMISEVPLGAFLSGGIDSSITVGLMARLASQRIKTFSIGFTHESFNELPYARQISERNNTEHHELIVEIGNLEQILPKLVEAFDEPFADSCAFQTYYLAQLTREHVTVVLNGDGGDETFAGYPRYWLDKYIWPYSFLPDIMTQSIIPALLRPLKSPTNIPIESNWILGLKRLEQVARITPKASIVRWGSYFEDNMKYSMYTRDMLSRVESESASHLLAECFDRANAGSFLDRTLYVDLMNYLPGNNLVKTDRMTMAHSLEARSPFLDHQYVEFSARLPERFKIRNRFTKRLLRETFGEMLPHQIKDRPKRGFGAPIEDWLKHDLKDLVREKLFSNNSPIADYIRPDSIRRLAREHESGKNDHGRRIWALLTLALWFERDRSI
jgi:asparagine synthase (glutamine-hydrolysing)